MVPESWLSLAFFALLVAPGLVFDLLARRRRVGQAESTFREISRVVLASTGFSAVGLLAVGVVGALRPNWMPIPRQLFTAPDPYVYDHPGRVVAASAIQLTAALGAAMATHFVLARKTGSTLRPVSPWSKTLREDAPESTTPHVRIRLQSGTVFVGRVNHYTAQLEVADREIVLAPPLFSKTGGNALVAMPSRYQRLVVRGSQIESIAIEYRAATDDPS